MECWTVTMTQADSEWNVSLVLWWQVYRAYREIWNQMNCCRSKCHGENVKSGEKTTWNIVYIYWLIRWGEEEDLWRTHRKERGLEESLWNEKKRFERKTPSDFCSQLFFSFSRCEVLSLHSTHLQTGNRTFPERERTHICFYWSTDEMIEGNTIGQDSPMALRVFHEWSATLGERVMRSREEKEAASGSSKVLQKKRDCL